MYYLFSRLETKRRNNVSIRNRKQEIISSNNVEPTKYNYLRKLWVEFINTDSIKSTCFLLKIIFSVI